VAKKLTYTEADAAFRHALYHFIVTRGHVPKIGELTAALSRSQKTVRSALQRLGDLHILVLQQNTSEVLRAAPFWAVPTAFHVQSACRVRVVSLTAKGRRLIAPVFRKHAAEIRRVFADTSPKELRALETTLKKIGKRAESFETGIKPRP